MNEFRSLGVDPSFGTKDRFFDWGNVKENGKYNKKNKQYWI
jgi:hypothetical protein